VRTTLRAALMGLGRALGGSARRPLPTILATGAVGVSLLLVGLVVLTAQNVARLSKPWGQGVQMVVYLEETATPERARAIADVLRGVNAIERVDYVPPDQALARLEESLGPRRDLLTGVEVGWLPASLEVTLAPGVREVAEASPLVAKLRATPGVEEVEFLGDWVDKVASLVRSLRLAAAGLALIVALACVYVVAGTITLGMVARREEIEVLKLVGATDRFVKAPLLVEGALQGLLGAGVAVGLLFAVFRLGAPALSAALAGVLGPAPLTFLPGAQLGITLAVGAGLGLVGSWVAIGRYADA
jgi:cell division transport system permease protein